MNARSATTLGSAVTEAAADALLPRPRSPRPARVLVSTGEWPAMIGASVAAALLAAPLYLDDSPWLAVAVALTTFVGWHSLRACTVMPWLPGLIALVATLQWVLAPWMIYHYQSVARVSPMAVDAARYFGFAVPATLALVVGMYLPLWRSGRGPARSRGGMGVSRSFQRTCDGMVAVGVLARTVLLPLTPTSLRFVSQLLGHFVWVGAFGLLLAGARGWPARVGIALAAVALSNVVDLQFLDVLTWAACLALLLYYKYRPRLRVVIPGLAVLVVTFMTLQAFKRGPRDDIRRMELDQNERAATAGATLYAIARDPGLVFSPTNVIASADRLNEGYLIARTLAWVPAAEPFADGETIVTALRSAAIPRVLDPGKYVVGGAEIVPRFTGLELINGTSMGLSVPGELYCNFGETGAIVGTFVYGLLLGAVFRWLMRRARGSSVWWAWAPFLLISTISAEQGVSEVLNQIVKSAIVMWAVVKVVPAWAQLRRRARSARTPTVASAAALP